MGHGRAWSFSYFPLIPAEAGTSSSCVSSAETPAHCLLAQTMGWGERILGAGGSRITPQLIRTNMYRIDIRIFHLQAKRVHIWHGPDTYSRRLLALYRRQTKLPRHINLHPVIEGKRRNRAPTPSRKGGWPNFGFGGLNKIDTLQPRIVFIIRTRRRRVIPPAFQRSSKPSLSFPQNYLSAQLTQHPRLPPVTRQHRGFKFLPVLRLEHSLRKFHDPKHKPHSLTVSR